MAAYRSGYLPEDRRRLEAALSDGRLVGLATTTALELGVNITGLDAVLIAGWPGTWASLWQQAGRAGRSGRSAAAVLIARDDPLDTYLVRHPEILLRHPVEATVLDPDNPYVLAPHLCAAAAELPLTEPDLDIFGPAARAVVDDLTRAGRLRRRPAGWYSMRRNAAAAAGLRGAGLAPVRVVEEATGRLVGTVDEPSAHLIVHEGAVYVHQGDSYLVGTLDLDDRVALVEPCDPGYTTTARDVTEVEVRGELRRMTWGQAEVRFGDVQVTRQVVSFTSARPHRRGARRDPAGPAAPPPADPGGVVDRIEDLADALTAAGIDLGGAAHAAEHAAIGLLPLFATCDRWDIGGVSAARHPATGLLTVFVYDGHDGGAGFAERGFQAAADWLRATRQAIASCDCEPAAPPACSHPNAVTPTTRCPSGARSPSSTPCWPTRGTRGWPTRAERAPGAVESSAVLQRIRPSSRRGEARRQGEKEAGAAGGESGARAHGPALGGEAGSVLSISLSAKCPRMRPPVSVSRPPVAYPPQVPVAASAQSNYNICRWVLEGSTARLATGR